MADSILRDKAKGFAKDIVFACRDMKKDKKESVLINQLLRSATSIGANIHEAQYAQGTKDFISKLEIAQKEQQRRCTRKDTTPVLFAIRRVVLLRSFIVLRTVLFASRVLRRIK